MKQDVRANVSDKLIDYYLKNGCTRKNEKTNRD